MAHPIIGGGLILIGAVNSAAVPQSLAGPADRQLALLTPQ
jgi:hypothetical protein